MGNASLVETFTGSGLLTAHIGELGAWSLMADAMPAPISPVIVASRISLGSGVAFPNQGAFTATHWNTSKGVEIFVELQWPSAATDSLYLYWGLNEGPSGGTWEVALTYASAASLPGIPGWLVQVGGPSWTYYALAPAAIPLVTPIRLGVEYAQGGGAKFYSAPVGGGTKTYLVTDVTVSVPPATSQLFFELSSQDPTSDGWLDNYGVLYTSTAIPAKVTVLPALAIVGQGGQAQFVGTAYDASGNTLSDTLTWASNNTALASVDSTGLVTAATGSFTSGFVTISASDGTYATGSAPLAVILINVGMIERGVWTGTNSAPGSGRYIREVVYGIGTTGWETPTPSWGTNQWPWPSSITTQPNGAGPQIGFEVISGSTSTSSAPTGIAVQEYNNGILLSSTTAFTNPAWSSASTYALRLFWDGSSSKLTPYWNGSGSTSTGTAISLSSAFTNTWALQNWLGGVDHPSAVSADRQGYWLRSTATGNPWQPYYAL